MLPLADASRRPAARPCIAWRSPSATGALLREMWRVLTPEGRLLLIVPNRRGIWARWTPRPSATAGPTAAASSSGC